MTSENNNDDDDVKIISNQDKKIKLIGEIFSNDSCRKILKLISNDIELTAKEISQENSMSLTLVIHHLKRMQTTGMVKISKTGISAKGQEMKYYTATNQSFLITPEKSIHPIIASLKKFSKFAAIGLAGITSWAAINSNNNASTDFSEEYKNPRSNNVSPSYNEEQSVDDKWSSGEQSELDIDIKEKDFSDADMDMSQTTSEPNLVESNAIEEQSLEIVSEPVPEPKHETISDSEISHSGIEEFAFQFSEDHTNTGSVSLDEAIYPVPFTPSADPIESAIITIAIPILVVISGLIIERILSKWWNKRKYAVKEEK